MNERNSLTFLNSTNTITRYLRVGSEYIDLTGYTVTIKFIHNGQTKVEREVVVHPDQVNEKGRVDFTPIFADFDEIGRYRFSYLAVKDDEEILFPRGNRQRLYLWVK